MINDMTESDYKKINELNKQLELDQNNLDLLFKKAFIYYEGYDDENTIKAFEHIINLYPNYIEAYFWLSYYLFQIAAMTDQAIKIAKEGLKIDQHNGGLYAVIAWSIGFMDGDEKEFLYNIKKSIELEPTWISTRISLIEHLIKYKKFDEARSEIVKATLQIQDNFTVPTNNINFLFECEVTRRCDKNAKKDLHELLEECRLNLR